MEVAAEKGKALIFLVNRSQSYFYKRNYFMIHLERKCVRESIGRCYFFEDFLYQLVSSI